MNDMSVEARRDAVVSRLRTVREEYVKCTSDVAADLANNGSEWSISDLLRHASTDSFYRNMTQRLLEEESPQFGAYNPKAAFQRLLDGTLTIVDDTLTVASSVTPGQLRRVGTRNGQPYAVIDALESSVAHFEEHLAQLRDEIRPREGLPKV